MAGSLQDQLVKAGLATRAQAKQAERQKRTQARQERQSDAESGRKEKPRVQKQNTAKAERDRAIALERNRKAEARALRAQIKQIILQNDERVKSTSEDDVPYNFVHGTRIKRIHVSPAQRDKLVDGRLVIVNNDGLYHFVAPKVAQQIAQRDPKRIILANADKPAADDADDAYYAKFKIPDDLDW